MRILTFMIATLSVLLFGCQSSDSHKPVIAILTPVTHPSLEQIEAGFKAQIEFESAGQYRFVTYNAQGSKTLMRGEVEAIAKRDDVALVFTIGAMASQMTKEVFDKKQQNTPVVFTCVSDPVGFQIVGSEAHPGGNITGVKQLIDVETELKQVLAYKSNMRTIVLVLNPMEPGIAQDADDVAAILAKLDLALIRVEVFQSNECLAKVAPQMANADAVLVLKDNTVVSALDPLVKLCNRHQVPLLTSDLDSPDRGAAFGYGVHEVDFGTEGANKALQILDHKANPGDIPVTPVSRFELRINRTAAAMQGISLERLEAKP